MNNNILNFYLKAINLKNVDRTGWKEVGVKTIESVMDHIGGTILLAMAINSEKNLNLDMSKVYEMIAIKELKKLEKEESVINGGEYSDDIKAILPNSDLVSLYEEYENGSTPEAKFALMVSKLESDIQAKKYEKDGEFTIENAKKDIENYPEDIKSRLTDIQNASDGWLEFDRKYYDDMFNEISSDIQRL